jgi:dihydrofolate reductase
MSETNTRKVFVYIACSLDGFIAKPNDDLSFLKRVEKEGEDYGYAAFLATIDTIILGRKTFDWVAKQIGKEHYTQGDRNVYVLTRTSKPADGKITYYTESVSELMAQLKTQVTDKHIFCDGGAEVIHALLNEGCIDEFIVSVIPVLLGDGVRLFKTGTPELSLTLVSAQSFDTGLVQLHYRKQ